MSIANLAARLDALDAGGAFVAEGEGSVTVSRLSAVVAAEIAALAGGLGWAIHISDEAGTAWALGDLDEAYAPFRAMIDKPEAPVGVLRILTKVGFAEWLGRGDTRAHWQVAGLSDTIIAQDVCITDWEKEAPAPPLNLPLRSPRTLVREYAAQRAVPSALGRWLLSEDTPFVFADPLIAIWANAVAHRLILSLPDEYDAERHSLRFKGPPRLDLKLPEAEAVAPVLGEKGFLALQTAARWVFEIERETEMRHILLSTELARCGGSDADAAPFLRDNLEAALEGARTAYQIQLAGLSNDTLKALAELRKSLTDETAKVVDATRQIITALAGALAVGVGLIAARLTSAPSPVLLMLVMGIAAIYVAITILSGIAFMRLQRQVRAQWQPRLYRFLSVPDYQALVSTPAGKAENMLKWSAALGGVAVVAMAAAIYFVGPATPETSVGGGAQNGAAPGNTMQQKTLEEPPSAAVHKVGDLKAGNKAAASNRP